MLSASSPCCQCPPPLCKEASKAHKVCIALAVLGAELGVGLQWGEGLTWTNRFGTAVFQRFEALLFSRSFFLGKEAGGHHVVPRAGIRPIGEGKCSSLSMSDGKSNRVPS